MSELFRGFGIEIELPDEASFLKVKETLTRCGVASIKDNKLYQSCHILHKQGRFVIIHFKELFRLDGRHSDISEEDIARRNTIANLLNEWGLVRIIDMKQIEDGPKTSISYIKVLPFSEKKNWTLEHKYTIGKRKK